MACEETTALYRAYRLWYNRPQMTSPLQRGFTIVETMLFLAIGGILFAVLMVGVGTGITQQRYTESVRSYKALLQDQYAQVLNTSIGSDANWHCESNASGTISDTAPRGARGASECVILGRAIQVKANGVGDTIISSSVTGYNDTSARTDIDDLEAIKAYKPKLGTFNRQETTLDWGSRLRSDGQASTAVILIVRSPASGLIRVFTSKNPVSQDLASVITADNTLATATLRLCVDGDSGLLPKQVLAVNPQLASADAIATDTSDNGECR